MPSYRQFTVEDIQVSGRRHTFIGLNDEGEILTFTAMADTFEEAERDIFRQFAEKQEAEKARYDACVTLTLNLWEVPAYDREAALELVESDISHIRSFIEKYGYEVQEFEFDVSETEE